MAVLALSGCAGGARDPGSYSDTVKKNFVGQCWVTKALDANPKVSVTDEESLTKKQDQVNNLVPKADVTAAKSYCSCVYAALKKNMKFATFKKVNDDLRDKGGKLPESFTRTYQDCKTGPT